jgi:hypothetical protein
MTTASRLWDTITEGQRQAWRDAAASIQTRARLGMSGPMTGNQLFCKINCALLEIGSSTTTSVPAAPSAAPQLPTALVVSVVSHQAVLKLTAVLTPAVGSMLWAGPLTRPGVERPPQMVSLGLLGAPANSAIDITATFTARFGLPVAGQKIFVGVRSNQDGWEGPLISYHGFCPSLA